MKQQDQHSIQNIELEDPLVRVWDEHVGSCDEGVPEVGVDLWVQACEGDPGIQVKLTLREIRRIHAWLEKSQLIAERLYDV